MHLLQKVIKPDNCIIAFGIPTTDIWTHNAAIDNCRDDPKRFINQTKTHRPLNCKEYQLILPEDKLQLLSNLGASVLTNMPKKNISSLFSGEHMVVIPFTHWHNNTVEFYDGFISINDFISEVPESGASIICDLSICNPGALADAMKKKRNDYHIRYSNSKLNTHKWLNILITFLRVLQEEDICYPMAWEKTASLWVRGK